MPTPPERYKAEGDLTVNEVIQKMRTRDGGEPPPKFERDEYKRHRADALRAAGLEEEADAVEPGERPIEELSAAELVVTRTETTVSKEADVV